MKYLKPFGVALLCFAFLVPSAEAAQPSSLVGHWKFDEPSGTNVSDSSGYGNNGTMLNGPVPSTDVPAAMNVHFPDSHSLSFDGTNDSVDFGNVDGMGTSDLTLATWFKTSDTDAVPQLLIGKNGPGYLMELDASGKLGFNLTDNVTYVSGSQGTDYRDGAWHHAVITFNRHGNATFYIDGTAIGTTDISSQSGSLGDAGDPLDIGESGNNMFFHGLMDDARIYNRVLSAGEVTALASGQNTAAVTSVSVPTNGTYIAGNTLDFTVTYNEAVTVNTTGGTPRIPITLASGGPAYANYMDGSGTTQLAFRYTVGAGQNDSDGIVLGAAIDANGGTLKSSGDDVSLTLASVGNTSGILVDAIVPAPQSFSPANGATGVALNPTLSLTFNKTVHWNTGNILIKKVSDDTTVETISAAGGSVSGSGTSVLTIDPQNTLSAGTAYYITIPSSAILDTAGNAYAGISDNTTWSFTTLSAPVATSQHSYSSGAPVYGCKDTAALNYEEFVASNPALCHYATTPTAAITTTTAATATAPVSTLTARDLKRGMTGSDVLALQKFLNANGFVIATAGTGSLGSETPYFGALTRAALAKYQTAHGIVPATGYFGSLTRAQMKTAGVAGIWW
jgi:hypothetical protein